MTFHVVIDVIPQSVLTDNDKHKHCLAALVNNIMSKS